MICARHDLVRFGAIWLTFGWFFVMEARVWGFGGEGIGTRMWRVRLGGARMISDFLGTQIGVILKICFIRLSSWASLYWALSKWRLMKMFLHRAARRFFWRGLGWIELHRVRCAFFVSGFRFQVFECWIFRCTDWRNGNNLKNLFHTIFTLSELVLSFVEMKANENVFTQSCTEVFLKGIGLNRVTQSALRFFCFRFQVSSFWMLNF